ADDLAFIKSAATDVFNHAPAKLFANTGTVQFGRPSMGSWINYGIGSESSSLPGFVVLQSGPRGPRGGAVNWGNGLLPSAERGVRFVQLYHTEWDHHGTPGQTLTKDLDGVCRDIDQPCAALIKDLKSRGLLDTTLVVWGGEFGRTPMGEIRETVGRNHHIDS